MSVIRRLGSPFLAGAAMLLWLAPQAQAQFRLWRHSHPECIEELAKPPVVLDKPSETPKKPVPEVTPDPEVRTTAALGDRFVSVPQIMGDFGGYCGFRTVGVPVISTITTVRVVPNPPGGGGIPPITQPPIPGGTTTITTTERRPVTRQVLVCDPLTSRAGSGFKVADNESPKPTDRVFFTYNYFDGLRGEGGSVPRSLSVQPTTLGGSITTDVPAAIVTERPRNVHRELFGFEKTFLGGDASVELRLPLYQTDADDAFNADDFGDLTVVTRYALINDYETGNVFSIGLAVTAPTGPAIDTIAGDINSTLIQPWFGYVRRAGNFYFQGIHAVLIPTNSDDVSLVFNDLSTGYIIPGSSRGLAFLAPNFEVHVTTPLEGHDERGAVHVPDIVTLTGGVHVGFGQGRTLLSLGIATPVTGPRPMDVEGFVQLNFRF